MSFLLAVKPVFPHFRTAVSIVESVFLPFSVGGITFVLSAAGFLQGAAGLSELSALFCQ